MRPAIALLGLLALLPKPQVEVQVLIGSRGVPGYGFSRAIIIDHTKVPNTDQTNFPVAVAGTYTYLKTVGNGGKVQSSSGFDIIFTSDSAGQTLLACEQESWDGTTGAVAYWIRIPTLSHVQDTTVYVWYGNSGVSTEQCTRAAVWDSNYKAVWHNRVYSGTTGDGFCGIAGGHFYVCDSTGNGHTGDKSGGSSPAATGLIGGALSAGVASVPIAGTFAELLSGTTLITIETWLEPFDVTNGLRYPAVGPNASSQSTLFLNFGRVGSNNNTITFGYTLSSTFANRVDVNTTSNTLTNSVWHHVTAVLDIATTGNDKIYFNGQANSGTGAVVGSPGSTFATLTGTIRQGFDGYNSPNFFNGLIDEMRLSVGARSADWATTSYNNQSSPSTFYSVGSEVIH